MRTQIPNTLTPFCNPYCQPWSRLKKKKTKANQSNQLSMASTNESSASTTARLWKQQPALHSLHHRLIQSLPYLTKANGNDGQSVLSVCAAGGSPGSWVCCHSPSQAVRVRQGGRAPQVGVRFTLSSFSVWASWVSSFTNSFLCLMAREREYRDSFCWTRK